MFPHFQEGAWINLAFIGLLEIFWRIDRIFDFRRFVPGQRIGSAYQGETMWTHSHVVTTNLSVEDLWAAVSDISHWPTWQPWFDSIQVDQSGCRATVVEHGRQKVYTILESKEPTRIVVAHWLIFTRVRMEIEFHQVETGTRINICLKISGPLSFAYSLAEGDWHQWKLSVMVILLIMRARKLVAERCGSPPVFLMEPQTGVCL